MPRGVSAVSVAQRRPLLNPLIHREIFYILQSSMLILNRVDLNYTYVFGEADPAQAEVDIYVVGQSLRLSS
jgi:hypothetical protein